MAALGASALEGVHQGWLALFGAGFAEKVGRVLEAVGGDDPANVTPSVKSVLNAFKHFSPAQTACVVVGQDPYPQGAQGLSFSQSPPPNAPPGGVGKVPPSLVNIFGTLEAQGLAGARKDAKGRPLRTPDISCWARQGVLMLNTALTTQPGGRGSHMGAWDAFTRELVETMCAEWARTGACVPFLLWGGAAKKLAALIRKAGGGACPVFEWSHPSHVSFGNCDNSHPPELKFVHCPHFARVNEVLVRTRRLPIEWDPLAGTLAFTDGACSETGKPTARGGWAFETVCGPVPRVARSGAVPPLQVELVDPQRPELGFWDKRGAPLVPPTNNRAEFHAMAACLAHLLAAGVRGPVEVVADSELVVKTLEDWLPKRRAKGTAHELKNFDLVEVCEALLAALRRQALAVRLTRVDSHQPRPQPEAAARIRVLWAGNARVDRAAQAAVP
jgi:uracil-DNA glycosylase